MQPANSFAEEKIMPFTRLFYHLVWATKNRLPLVVPEIEVRLFAYFRKKAGEIECRILDVNGCEDHVHLLVEIPPKLSVAEAVKRLKGASSHEFPELYWQRGYGALTVSERNLDAAQAYIRQQKEHHMQQTVHARLEQCEEDGETDVSGVHEEPANYAAAGNDPF
jgi:putative transposase